MGVIYKNGIIYSGGGGSGGTPITFWESGKSYTYGDLVIYSNVLYYCTVANSDVTFDDTKWAEIGSSEGNYDIIQDATQLPSSFTSTDRKMYYSIADELFYLWDGTNWVLQEAHSLTTEQINNLLALI